MTTEVPQNAMEDAVAMKLQGKGDDLKMALKKQIEYYFSKQNLTHDSYLVSHMNGDMYVPLEIIAQFSKIKELTDDVNLIIEALEKSSVCTLNDDKTGIKPNIKTERNTIILREIPSETTTKEVEAIFEGCGNVSNVRSDVGDTWFVTMASEDEAVKTLLALRSKTFNGLPIKARLKSESTIRSFLPSNKKAAASPAVSYPNGYYQPSQGGVNYYAPASNYAAPYQYQAAGTAFDGQQASQQRYRAGNRPTQRGSGRYHAQGNKEPRAKSGTRKNKEKRGKNDKKAMVKKPVLNTANFPPLSSGEKPKEVLSSGYSESYKKYTEDDIIEVVKNMSNEECELPEGKMDLKTHSVVLNVVAHADLLKSQRTYSIEQAREAMRQGRPIRSDSVGSMDYESMMYGEEYTKEARAERAAKLTANVDAKSTGAVTTPVVASSRVEKSEPQQEPHPKKGGYAAALLSSPPAPVVASTPPPNAKNAKGKTNVAAAKGDKKRAAKKEGGLKKKEAASPPPSSKQNDANDKSPWGSKRSFLDVVKTADQAKAAASVAAAKI